MQKPNKWPVNQEKYNAIVESVYKRQFYTSAHRLSEISQVGVQHNRNIRTGFPDAFIQACLDVCQQTGRSISLRDGQDPNPGGLFKPMTIKQKTTTEAISNVLAAGYLPIHPALQRAGSYPVKEENKKGENQVHCRGTLRRLLSGKNMQFRFDPNTGILYSQVTQVDSAKASQPGIAQNIIYRIDLNQSRGMVNLSEQQRLALATQKRDEAQQLGQDKETLLSMMREYCTNNGMNEVNLDNEYNLDMFVPKVGQSTDLAQTPDASQFEPVMLAGNRDLDKAYTGDADIFAITYPIAELMDKVTNRLNPVKADLEKRIFIKQIFKEGSAAAKEVEQSLQNLGIEAREALTTEALELFDMVKSALSRKESKKDKRRLSILEAQAAQTTAFLDNNIKDFARFVYKCKLIGLATVNEFVTAYLINKKIDDSDVREYLENLIQHGPETNNPGKPSSLDDTITHVYNNRVIQTKNEDELIAFYMQPGYLDNHFLPVHPKWNMEKWALVVNRQIELGQISRIQPSVITAYAKQIVEHNLPLPKFKSSDLSQKHTFTNQLWLLKKNSPPKLRFLKKNLPI